MALEREENSTNKIDEKKTFHRDSSQSLGGGRIGRSRHLVSKSRSRL